MQRGQIYDSHGEKELHRPDQISCSVNFTRRIITSTTFKNGCHVATLKKGGGRDERRKKRSVSFKGKVLKKELGRNGLG